MFSFKVLCAYSKSNGFYIIDEYRHHYSKDDHADWYQRIKRLLIRKITGSGETKRVPKVEKAPDTGYIEDISPLSIGQRKL